ncbi:acyl-ACP thioesterase domain-containing protein, partial [Enterococcus faecalis]
MAKKYTKKHEVSYYECDINQTMTFPSMLGVVIKTSEDQSDQLGRGSEFV